MRKFAVALALATTALAGPALARDHAWYVGADAGGMLLENMQFDLTNAAKTVVAPDGIKAKYEYGYDVDGVIGYDFGGFRTEFELGYKNANVNSIRVQSAIPAIQMPYAGVAVPPIGTYQAADGNAEALSFMVNGLFDFGGHEDYAWSGFLGGGVGIARVNLSNLVLVKYGAHYQDDSDTGVAWQVLAGVRKSITKHVDLSLKYRYFNVSGVNTFTTNAVDTDTRWRSHSLLLGLTYNFYEEPAPVVAPPPPPPVAAPLPPCPPAAVTPGPFLVFFDWDKSLITPEGAQILDRAADQYTSTGQTSVALAGYTDTSGTPDYNLRLSQRRADAVKAYMATKGVPDGVMTATGLGETNLLVQTADGVREPQNRRVEITFGGAPAPTSSGPCTPQ